MIAEIREVFRRFYEVTGTHLVSITVSEAVYDALNAEMALGFVTPASDGQSLGAAVLDGVQIRWVAHDQT